MKLHPGVTLLEVLLTISLLVVVISIGVTSINPSSQLGRADDTERKSEIRAIQLAISQYQKDNNGNVPDGITSTAINICQPGCTESATQIDISSEINTYFENGIPVDPDEDGDILTGYTLSVSDSGEIVVAAPNAAQGPITTE